MSVPQNILGAEQLLSVLEDGSRIADYVKPKQISSDLIKQLVDAKASDALCKLIRGNYRINEREVAVIAISAGYTPPLETLLRVYYGFTSQHLQIAVVNNVPNVIAWLLSNGVTASETTVQTVVRTSTVEIVKMFHRAGVVFTPYHLLQAAETDNYDVYLYLRANGVKVEEGTALIAGPKVLADICDRGPHSPAMGPRVLELIADVSVWERLYESGVVGYDGLALITSIERGDLKAVKWLYSLGLKIKAEHSLYAAKAGSLKLLDWFAYMQFPIDSTLAESLNSQVRLWYERYSATKIRRGTDQPPERISSLIEQRRITPTVRRRSNTSFTPPQSPVVGEGY